jgi:hypothetical protein
MAEDKSRLRQGILRFEEERAEELEAVLSERRPLNRGSVVRRERVCGHAQCRCVTQKQLHVSAYLSVPVKGKTRALHLPKGDEQRVREATERYRKFRQARMRLVRLGAKQLELVDRLGNALLEAYPPGSTIEPAGRRGPKADKKRRGGSR